MAATTTLFRKELRQHGPALLGISLLLAAIWLLGWFARSRDARVLSVLDMLPTFAQTPLTAVALYLGHRLVVREYYERTQRFVESLPVRRGQMVLVKAVFGLGWMLAWAGLALLATAALAARTEPVTPRFLAIMAARLGLYVFALWGVVFVFGFFGRLRAPLAVGVGLVVYALDRSTAWQVQQFGPLRLIDSATFPFERLHFPEAALLQAAAVGAAGFALAYALARVREGSVVEALARRLSARELSAFLVMAGGAVTLLTTLAKEAPAPPYRFTTDKLVRSPNGSVEIAYLDDALMPSAQRLADGLEPQVKATADLLALPAPLPPVRIVHGPELPVRQPRTVANDDRALVLRANLQDLDADAATNLRFRVLHALLSARTRGRAGLESKHWLLDGFTLNVARSGQPAPAPADPPDADLLRAVVATGQHPVAETFLETSLETFLADYATTSDRLGDDLTDAVAASGWRYLGTRVGPDRIRALAQAALSRRGTGDVRDTWHDWRTPLPRLFTGSTGLEWPAFVRDWQAALARARVTAAGRAALAALPRAQFQVLASAQDGVGVHATLPEPLPRALTCTLRHRRLPPFDAEIDNDELEDLGFVWPTGARDLDRVVTGVYGRGERAFVALECDVAVLGCPVRLATGRVTVR